MLNDVPPDCLLLLLQDDARWLRSITDTLAATQERVAVEFDLKQVLGLRLKRGHRTWRRLRNKLESQGYIESFVGKVRRWWPVGGGKEGLGLARSREPMRPRCKSCVPV